MRGRGRGRGRGSPLSCVLFIVILHLFLTNTHSIQTQVLHIADSLVLFNHKQQVLRTLESSSTTAGAAFPPVAAPPPSSGGDLPSLPSDGWVTTSPTSTNNEPSPSPSSEDGIPFISSNPAVPIPTGETDTTTIRPLPMSGDGTQAVGLGWKDRIQMEVVVGLGVIMCFALSLWC